MISAPESEMLYHPSHAILNRRRLENGELLDKVKDAQHQGSSLLMQGSIESDERSDQQ